jgi:hypothetical protein
MRKEHQGEMGAEDGTRATRYQGLPGTVLGKGEAGGRSRKSNTELVNLIKVKLFVCVEISQ